MAIGFMSFGGMLTGGDEPAAAEDKTASVEVPVMEEEKTVAITGKEEIEKETAIAEQALHAAEKTNN